MFSEVSRLSGADPEHVTYSCVPTLGGMAGDAKLSVTVSVGDTGMLAAHGNAGLH
jgi:hypothetical protein